MVFKIFSKFIVASFLHHLFLELTCRIQGWIGWAAENLAPFFKLHGILARPFDEQPEHIEFQKPPKPEEVVHATFCGT